MRFKLFYILMFICMVIFCLAGSAAAEGIASHRDDEGLVGQVKAVVVEQAAVSPDGLESSRILVRKTHFNPAGYITRVTWYKDNRVYCDKGTQYDSANRVLASGHYLTDGSFQQETEFLYDRDGRLKEQRSFKPDLTLFFHKEFLYDESGRLVAENRYNADGVLDTGAVYEYNSDGNRAETRYFGSDGVVTLREIYEYSGQGYQTIKRTCKDGTADYGSKVYQYGLNGHRLEETDYLTDGSMRHHLVNNYVSTGWKTAQQHYRADGSLASITIYGPQGLPSAYYTYNNDGSVANGQIFIYKFDKAGNWIMKATYQRGQSLSAPSIPSEITYRTIAYY